MNTFSYSCPTKVIFGDGQLSFIHNSLPSLHKNVLVVSSKTAAIKSGALDTIKKSFHESRIRIFYKNTISPNPRLTEVDELAAFCIDNEITALIAVGGGSVIDAAKAVSLLVPSKLSCKQLLKHDSSLIAPLFLIAIPTTAGTGSEVSKGAIVTDVENSWKGGIRGENVFPKVAILDPQLTISLPKSITLETGFDVITHAFESLISKAANPITRMYSLSALEIAIPALILAAEDKASLEVRSKLMYASLLAGYNLANSSTCLPHRLQYPLGAKTDSAHARGLAALYPTWFKLTYRFSPNEFDFIGTIINRSLGVQSLVNDEVSSTTAIISLLVKIEMSHKLRDFGVQLGQCEQLAREVDGNLAFDPGCTKFETISHIYKGSW
ncbi:iron-containing alcohol dehydrogenase [Pseudomonadales bacterium]|nr:iron-containing alcohol dehydrogenase [Pseudomonadales bacterium]MDB9868750.1 iron-containing alcohol dehydrogenase [Pseudomonadales bacterium]